MPKKCLNCDEYIEHSKGSFCSKKCFTKFDSNSDHKISRDLGLCPPSPHPKEMPVVEEPKSEEEKGHEEIMKFIKEHGTEEKVDGYERNYVGDAPTEVNQPSHYTTGKIEVIDFIEDQRLGFKLANALKYICRARHKGTYRKDLQKAIWYLTRELENETEKGGVKDAN